MKTLIIYYSRTNTTEKAAELIAKKLNADQERVIDKKNRAGVFGYLGGGFAAVRGRTTAIGDLKHDPSDYDLVVIGTPVWVGRVSPAIRAYLGAQAKKVKRVAFFTTQGSGERQRVFEDLKELAGQEPAAELFLKAAVVTKGDPAAAIAAFCEKIKPNN